MALHAISNVFINQTIFKEINNLGKLIIVTAPNLNFILSNFIHLVKVTPKHIMGYYKVH